MKRDKLDFTINYTEMIQVTDWDCIAENLLQKSAVFLHNKSTKQTKAETDNGRPNDNRKLDLVKMHELVETKGEIPRCLHE